MSLIDKLKPCPFCGRSDIRVITTLSRVEIVCNYCGANILRQVDDKRSSLFHVNHTVKPRAVKAWNTRKEPKEYLVGWEE